IREGERALRRQSIRVAEELRRLRLRAGVSQAAVAASVGTTRSLICRFEQGDPAVSLRTRFRVAAALGADLRLSAYEGSGALIRDSRQAAIVEYLLQIRDRQWRPTVEASVPGPGRRSIDLRLDDGEDSVLFEVETRLDSLEEIVRELHSKRSAFLEAPGSGRRRRVHVVLVLPATRRHRAIIRAHPEIVRSAFPISSLALSRALAGAGEAWPGDGILWVPATSSGVARR
ncbi:MAG: helix-turn-helix transcriptional regulator, partial [Candidatus Limnocylindrales bacterium]